MITAHPNLYVQTSRADPLTRKDSREPWINMFSGDVFRPEWRDLVRQHSDRFILAFDNVWPEDWSSEYVKNAQLWRRALGELPLDVAQAVAHGNAERLWKIPSKNIVR